EIVVGIAEEGFGGGDEFGIVVAQSEHAAFVGRRGHGVDVAVIGIAGVGVVVIQGNAADFAEQIFVEFAEIRGGIGAGLRKSGLRQGERQSKKAKQMDHSFSLRTRKEEPGPPNGDCATGKNRTYGDHQAVTPRHFTDTRSMRSRASSRRWRALTREKR